MRIRRTLALGGFLVLVLLTAAVVIVELRRRALATQLISDVQALSSDRPRPVHRAPARDGTFEGCLGPLLDGAPDAGVLGFRQSDEVRAAVKGALAGGPLDQRIDEEVHRLRPWAGQVVECSHAAALGDAPGLGPFAPWGQPRNEALGLMSFVVPRVVLLDAARSTDAGAALRSCADVLALSRDLVADRGLIGAMLFVQTARMALQPCGAALRHADEPARRAFREELAVIRSSTPTFGNVLEIERPQMQVLAFGEHLSEDELAQLTENARGLAQNEQFWHVTGLKHVAARLYWYEYASEMTTLIEAAGKPEQDRVFEARDSHESLLLRMMGGGSASPMLSFARRYDAGQRGLTLLETAARVSLGEPTLPGVQRSADGKTLSVPWLDGQTETLDAL